MSSPHEPSRRAVPLTRVRVDDPFWTPRIDVNREVTLEHQWRMLVETGRVRNFELAADRQRGGFAGQRYNDSDVYKWMEAAAHSLANRPDDALRRRLDRLVETVAAAQEDDGYLDTWYQVECPEGKWKNLGMGHELYCAGHLIEAAIAHHQATGSRRLLDVAVALVEHVAARFGGDDSNAIPGHQEIELALVALARHLDEPRYLDLAQRFLDRRGRRPSRFEQELHATDTPGNHHDYRMLFLRRGQYDGAYAQDHAPLWQQDEAVGHAVRAMYQACAMTDVAALDGDPEHAATLERLWECVTGRRMYVTGGIGSSRHNEGFTHDHDLPNRSAYAETCAAIGLVLWAHRMFLARGEGRFGDVMERALFNGVLAGVSRDGLAFFYENPLASAGDHHRQGWFDCSCCPPNVSRLLQSLGRYVAAEGPDGVWLNLYVSGEVRVEAPVPMTLRVQSEWPWSGRVAVSIDLDAPREFTLALRQPEWARDATVTVNGAAVDAAVRHGFLPLRRVFQPGDVVQLELGMDAEFLVARPEVLADAGRVALRRGPLVYCFEAADHDAPLADLRVHPARPVRATFEPDMLGGMVVLRLEGSRASEDPDPSARRAQDPADDPASAAGAREPALYRRHRARLEPAPLTAIPYHLWDHRGGSGMAVWMPVHEA